MVAPGVAERVAAEDLDASFAGGCKDGRGVVDDEPEMALGIWLAHAALGKREELIAHVDKRHPGDPAAQLQLEQAPVELQRLVERADLDCDVIHPNRTSHGTNPSPRV